MPKQFQSKSGVIQLRPFRSEIYSFIINQLKKFNVDILDQKRYSDGIDIFINNQKISRTIARRLKKNFKGVLKMSYSFNKYDSQKGKKIHSSTLLFRAE